MKKSVSLLLALNIMLIMLSCCKKIDVSQKKLFDSVDFSQYKDTDDIPSWKGEKLKLIKWTCAGSANASYPRTFPLKDDPISKEIERVTGVSFDIDKSFDNGGSSYDSVIGKVLASNTFPHIGEGIPGIKDLVENNILWNIEPYLEKYAPTVYKLFGNANGTWYKDLWEDQKKTYGGVYEISFGSDARGLYDLAKNGYYELTDQQLDSELGYGDSSYPFCYVRSDILKKLYPQAHSIDELKEIYEKNGKFTEEEIFDVPINSPEDFKNMLYAIKDLNLSENGKPVYATFTHVGSDNWPVFCQFGPMFGFGANNTAFNYFCYYDKNSNTIKPTYKEPWFKDLLKTYQKLILDGVASEDALIDTNAIFGEKIKNGLYAVGYGSYIKSEYTGSKAMRKVYGKYKINDKDYIYSTFDYTSYNKLTFFKSMSECELIQVLNMLEYLASDAGQKMSYWGTREMGLYTEEADGTLKYKDETIRNEMCNPNFYGYENIEKLGLHTYSWPGSLKVIASKYRPNLSYVGNGQTWNSAFDAVFIEKLHLTKCKPPLIFSSEAQSAVPNLKFFWDSRKGFEDELLKVFAAKNDAEFEKQYRKVLNYAETHGLTDETFAAFNKFYKEDFNKEYEENIK